MLHKNTAQTQPTKGRIERGVSHAMLLKVVESLWAYQNAYCSCDIDAVHGWLIHVQEMLWSLVHPWLVLVCIMVLVSFRFIGLAHLHSLSGCLSFVGFPSGFGLVCLGLCPLVSFLRCWLAFRWAVCTFGVVWAPWPPDAMESFVPVGPLPSVFMACFCGGLLRLLWLPPRSALSIWGQFRSGYGSIPINTIFRGMNIHLPAVLMFTRGTRFWHTAIKVHNKTDVMDGVCWLCDIDPSLFHLELRPKATGLHSIRIEADKGARVMVGAPKHSRHIQMRAGCNGFSGSLGRVEWGM